MAATNCKKKVKPGAISLDPVDAALVIEIETQLITSNDQIVSKSQSQKRVGLHAYLSAPNLADAAAAIVIDCKYIHKSKVAHVEGLLRQCIERQQLMSRVEAARPTVLERKVDKPEEATSDKSDADSDLEKTEKERPGRILPKKGLIHTRKDLSRGDVDAQPIAANYDEVKSPPKHKRPKEKATIHQLDSYLELLYEDNIEEVIRSAGLLAQIARNPDHLDILCGNGTAIGALTRILNENRKKNTDLVVNILDIFRSISLYPHLHVILLNSKIGDTTMKVVDLECKRYDMRRDSSAEKPSQKFLFKQHKVLGMALSILLNLAEDVQIEVKMVNRGIISYLISTLSRENAESSRSLVDLKLLALAFMKKLSIMKENVDSMAESNLVSILAEFNVAGSQPMATAILRLLFNLSFHATLRDQIIQEPALLSLAAFGLKGDDEAERQAAIKFLYNLSVHNKGRMCVASDANIVAVISDLVLHSRARPIPEDLIGLAISLSTVDKVAMVMCEKDAITALVKRALTTTDVLLMKLLHNLSVHPVKGKEHFNRYLADFISLAKRSQRNEFLVETLGIIGNIDQPGTSFARIISNSDFIDFLVKHLVPGFTDDDIVLGVIIVIGTLATDPHCAPILASSRLIRLLADTLTEKSDDEEIILQTMFCIYRLMCYEETRSALLALPNLMDKLVYVHKIDTNSSVQDFAARSIVIGIAQASDIDQDKIKTSIFEMHNFEWLNASSNKDDVHSLESSALFNIRGHGRAI